MASIGCKLSASQPIAIVLHLRQLVAYLPVNTDRNELRVNSRIQLSVDIKISKEMESPFLRHRNLIASVPQSL